MLPAALILLSAAAALGALLAALHLRTTGSGAGPGRGLGVTHGTLGIAGFVALLLGIRAASGPLGTLGLDAVLFLAGAVALGLAIPVLWHRSGATPGLTMALHAFVAMVGYALVAVFVTG